MGFAREEEEMMIENRAKTESKTEEMETAMATIGLVLLIAAAKHYAFTPLVQQWRPLLVFFLLNLLLMAILITSSSLTSKISNEKKKKKKINYKNKVVNDDSRKIKHVKTGKKYKKSSTAASTISCNGNNSWYLSSVQAVEDYFCKISEVEQEKISRLSHDERRNDHFEVCNDSSTVNDDHTPPNLSSTSSKEDINARVEAFIVMFRQQLAMDALQSSVMQSRNGAGVLSK